MSLSAINSVGDVYKLSSLPYQGDDKSKVSQYTATMPIGFDSSKKVSQEVPMRVDMMQRETAIGYSSSNANFGISSCSNSNMCSVEESQNPSIYKVNNTNELSVVDGNTVLPVKPSSFSSTSSKMKVKFI